MINLWTGQLIHAEGKLNSNLPAGKKVLMFDKLCD